MAEDDLHAKDELRVDDQSLRHLSFVLWILTIRLCEFNPFPLFKNSFIFFQSLLG